MLIIGVTGRAGSGKGEVAKRLCVTHGFVRTGFADPLKREVLDAYALPAEQLEFFNNRANKERTLLQFSLQYCLDADFVALMCPLQLSGPETMREMVKPRSFRQICQRWGTEYRRAQNQDYWLNKCDEFILSQCDQPVPPAGVVVDDLRFENEAKFLRRVGGTVINMLRDNITMVEGHVSETPLPQTYIDYSLNNNHTIRTLELGVDSLMAHLTEKAVA